MLKVRVEDGHGNGNRLAVTSEGKLCILDSPIPPDEEEGFAVPYRKYFVNSSGSNDMRVDGSTTNVEFSIDALEDHDLYIKNLAVLIADAGAAAREFGNLSALTNGVEFKWANQEIGDIVIDDGLKSNFDFCRLALGNPAIGSGTSTFVVPNMVGTSEGFIPNINLGDTFGLPNGIRLRRGTTDKLVFTVRDNITAIDEFNIVAYGIRVIR